LGSVTVLLLAGACLGPGVPDPREMTFPALRISPPLPERVVRGNGTVMHLIPDREVPLVDVQVMIRTGSALDPKDKVGLAGLTGRVLRTGGSRLHSGSSLSEKLDGMGAVLETSIGWESGRASLSVLSGDVEKGIELLAEILRYPRFEESEVERAKNLKIESIRRRYDDPDTVALLEFRAAVYGDDPRGRRSTVEGIASITRDDLASFHSRYFHPDRLIVGVSGDFEAEEFISLWDRHFGDWPPVDRAVEPFPVPRLSPPPVVRLARKGFPQSTILLGHLAPSVDSPDFFAFTLLNYILGGGGFNSRLMEEIRSNRGLAYSVGSWYRGDVGYGVFMAHCKTGPESTVEAARLTREIIEEVREDGVTAEELRWAKEAIINKLVFAVDSTAEVVSRKMSYEYDGLPPDFLETYPERIEAVGREELLRLARQVLRPRQAPMVVVGDGRDLADALAEFGTVVEVPLEDPVPAGDVGR
jgi:predicted Zn-dependent peptidase